MPYTMCRIAALVIAGIVLGVSPHAVAQSPPGRVLGCWAETNVLAVSGVVHTRAVPYFVEVELTVHNKSAAPLWFDPGRTMLVPDDGPPVAAASRDQVLQALRTPSPAYLDAAGVVVSGSFAVGVSVGPIDLRARALEARLLKAAVVAGEARYTGSVYYHPRSWPANFDVVVDGLRLGAGSALPAVRLRGCVMPVRPQAPPVPLAPSPPSTRRIETSARATAGPVTVSVSSLEIARFATTLHVTVENASGRDADTFVTLGGTHLVDQTQKRYALRILQSEVPERVPARGLMRGRLVFDPLPMEAPASPLTLSMPGFRIGDSTYDIAVILAF
jgi:hypothetical protein